MSADRERAAGRTRGKSRGSMRPAMVVVLVLVLALVAAMGIHVAMQSLPNGTSNTSWTPPPPPAPPALTPAAAPRWGGNFPANFPGNVVAPVGRPAAPGRAVQPEKLIDLTVIDEATQRPLAGALVQSIGARNRFRGLTDAGGGARVSMPATLRGDFEIELRDTGYVPVEYVWDSRDPRLRGPIPAKLTAPMERAVTVGGKVIDDAGKPVAGANVALEFRKTYADPDELADVGGRNGLPVIVTGKDGTWTFAGAPPGCQDIQMTAWDYHHVGGPQGQPVTMESDTAVAPFYSGTAQNTLSRGEALNGLVRDGRGNPVAGAEVSLGMNRGEGGRNDAIPNQYTDGNGRFSYAFSLGDREVITVQAMGYAPELKTVTMGDKPQMLMIELSEARRISGRVVDPLGRPVRARLSLAGWRGYQTIDANLDTDRRGRFVWTQAPADTVYFNVTAGGFRGAPRQALTAGRENVIQLTSTNPIEDQPAVVSDAARDVKYQTLDGGEGKLSDLRGKYVLVQFWSPASSQSLREISSLKDVCAAYGRDARLVMIGVAFAPNSAMIGKFAQANGIGWRQGLVPLGSSSASVVARDYGFPAICFLGPDGKVIGRNLMGGAIRAVVAGTLGPARMAVAATQPGGR